MKFVSLLLVSLAAACMPPPAPAPAPASQPGVTYTSGPVGAPAGVAGVATGTDTRKFMFNGRDATAADLQTLAQIEQMYGKPAPAGSYWYDAASGAAGSWGGPTLGFLPAGLALGGPLPANASGGGDGRLTGVFVNGRELHPIDVQVLTKIYGQVIPGRWWVDGQGNTGPEGGAMMFNLVQIARQRGGGAESYYRSDGHGNNAFVGGGCVSSTSTIGSGDDKRTYDYYGSGC